MRVRKIGVDHNNLPFKEQEGRCKRGRRDS